MPSIKEVGDRDEVLRKTLHLTSPRGVKFALEVGFYVNRVTQDPVQIELSDEDADETEAGQTGLQNAAQTCEWLADWDLTGPLVDHRGREIAGPGVIPLEPHVVRVIPSWLTTQITEKLLEIVFPNRLVSSRSRRR